MEKDKDSNILTRELGSFEVNEGAEYITKLYYMEELVHVFFDTKQDVEEWEYSAIYDLFNEDVFKDNGFEIEFIDDEYNPTWKIEFNYIDDYNNMKELINEICTLIKSEMERTMENIKGKENEYK
jgi:hypothetical protein